MLLIEVQRNSVYVTPFNDRDLPANKVMCEEMAGDFGENVFSLDISYNMARVMKMLHELSNDLGDTDIVQLYVRDNEEYMYAYVSGNECGLYHFQQALFAHDIEHITYAPETETKNENEVEA